MRRAVIPVVILAIVASATLAQMPRPLVLQVEQVPLAWGDGRLADMLTISLSRDPELRVIVPEKQAGLYRAFPADRTNLDSLLAWGVEIGGRYLLAVYVSHEGLECRKTFCVPLLFQRWETLAVISGEMRLVDLQKRRVMLAEPFEEKISAARQFQGSTDDSSQDGQAAPPRDTRAP